MSPIFFDFPGFHDFLMRNPAKTFVYSLSFRFIHRMFLKQGNIPQIDWKKRPDSSIISYSIFRTLML
jgi:hypothetical protein